MRACLFLLMMCVAQIGLAHQGSIRGVIYDGTTHKPLEGVAVYLKGVDQSAVTDVFGKFFIKEIDPGSYILTVSHLGYENQQNNVNIEDGVTTDVAYQMNKAPIQMSSVSVNARKDLNLSSISGIDLQLRPVNNTQDLMRLVPGLFTAQHQGGGKAEQIFLRGFDCDHGTDVNVSVDNMPVNMVSHAHGQGFADSHFIIPEAIAELDYGKGPYQIDKGNLCTAGFVAFKTKNELDNSFVKAEAGMYNYYRTVFGLNLLNRAKDSNGHQSAYVIGEYGYNRSYFTQSQDFNRFNIIGKYTDYIAHDKILSITLSGFGSFWNASGQIPTRAVDSGWVSRYGDIDPEGGITSRYNLNVQYLYTPNSNSYIKANIYATYYTFRLYSDFTYYLSDSVNGDQIRQAESRIMSGYNTEYTTSYKLLGLRMKIQVGQGLRYDEIMNDELSHTINKSTEIYTDPNFHPQLGDVHEANVFGYANQTIYLLPQLVLNAGTRYDVVSQQYDNKITGYQGTSSQTNGLFSPKAGIYYNFNDKARIYYNYGVGFHTNDTRTIALGEQGNGQAIRLNEAIPKAYSQDLGAVVKPYDRLLLSTALWWLKLQEEYTYDGDVAIVSSSGPTLRYGIDFSARYEVAKWLYLDVDMNYAHGREIDMPVGHNYIPLAPSFTSIGGATFKFARNFLAGIRYRHMSNRPANEDNTDIALGYTVFDMVASYSRSRYEFGVQVQNLFNVQWNEAQFDTETRLKNPFTGLLEAHSATDVCFTPGTPFFLKLTALYRF